MPVELVEEAAWLRHRIIRMRAALRFAISSDVQVILREFIADAENRITAVEENGAGHGAKAGACRLGSVLDL